MPTAVVRVIVDASLEPAQFADGIARLHERGLTLLEHSTRPSDSESTEIALLRDAEIADWTPEQAVALCQRVFNAPAELGVITYVSRGTDDDARSVLARFELSGDVRRDVVDGEDVITVTVARDDMRRVPESRLHTALEAALNAEVQIVLAERIS